MRYQEFNKTQAIRESMSFSARKQDPKTKAFMPVTGDQPRYEPDFYKPDWPYDKDPKPNPDYNPEEDLSLSNANMREVMDTLGYDAEDSIPIDEFIGRGYVLEQQTLKIASKVDVRVSPSVNNV